MDRTGRRAETLFVTSSWIPFLLLARNLISQRMKTSRDVVNETPASGGSERSFLGFFPSAEFPQRCFCLPVWPKPLITCRGFPVCQTDLRPVPPASPLRPAPRPDPRLLPGGSLPCWTWAEGHSRLGSRISI